MANNIQYSGGTDSDVAVEFDIPPQYKVVFYNDDYTTMEFVMEVLMTFFNKTLEEANSLMLEIHKSGRGVAGIYPYDIAATKARSVIQKARANGFPLQVKVEED